MIIDQTPGIEEKKEGETIELIIEIKIDMMSPEEETPETIAMITVEMTEEMMTDNPIEMKIPT
jgi:hypothetical protein